MPLPCPVGTDIPRAAAILRAGGLVAFPTETVYGLGGDALNPRAVAGIFEAKQRPHFDPLIVHIPELSWLPRIATRVSDEALRLAERFWPGPLTLILPKTEAVPDLVTSGLPGVAVRIPRHPMALELLRTAGTPLAGPSANPFGRISPTTAAHVLEQLGDRIDYILEGGPAAVGVESTVLQLPDPAFSIDGPSRPTLLRPGGLPLEEIEAVIGPVAIAEKTQLDESAAPSPGMLARHYAPRTPLRVIERISDVTAGKRDSGTAGLLTLTPAVGASRFAAVEVLSESGDLREAAARFFAALRRLDAAGLSEIVATPFPNHGLGRALNDRLKRAAAGSAPQ